MNKQQIVTGSVMIVLVLLFSYMAYGSEESLPTPKEISDKQRVRLLEEQTQIDRDNLKILDWCNQYAQGAKADEKKKSADDCYNLQKIPDLVIPNISTGTVTPASSGVPSGIKEDPISRPKVMDKFGLSGCRLTNTDHELERLNLSWYGYDYACIQGKTFSVYAPADVSVEKIGYDTNLGQYIVLKHKKDTNIRFVLGHIGSQLKEGQFIREGEKVGDVIEGKNGSSSGTHLHMEIWYGYTNVSYEFALGLKYKSLDGTVLLNDRRFNFGQPQQKKILRKGVAHPQVSYAWNKWKDINFILTIEAESGWDSQRIGDKDNPTKGSYSYGYCQYNSYWHQDKIDHYKSLPTLEDKITWCHAKYIEAMNQKGGISRVFHGYDARNKYIDIYSFE